MEPCTTLHWFCFKHTYNHHDLAQNHFLRIENHHCSDFTPLGSHSCGGPKRRSASEITSNCNNNRPFFNTKHPFSGAILDHLCLFNRKIRGNLAFILQFATSRPNSVKVLHLLFGLFCFYYVTKILD